MQNSQFCSLKVLDLSNSFFTDIKGLCGNLPFCKKLKVLNLSNNESITNLYELKNVDFPALEELNLSNNNIDDL